MIETRLLYYFLAIAREQSITKAAETLHVTQPTLSKQMMDLERQLGRQLFIRGKRKIELTEYGIFLRGRAQEMTELMEKTESAFHGEDELINGDISLGCGETRAMDFITGIFREIHEDYPNICFHIFSGNADTVIERLDKGLLDMGLLLGPRHDERYDYISLQRNDFFGILMPKGCPLSQKETVSFEDLKDLPLIFPEQSFSGADRLSWLGINDDAFHIVATYNLIFNATFMVEQGIGYAFCLENLVDTSGKSSLTFRPLMPAVKVNLYIVTKKYPSFSPAAKIFLERLKKKLA